MAVATAPGMPMRRRGGNRIGLVYAGLAVLMVVALLPALRPPRPPVPPVAAYAPEANQQLKTPPPEQSSTNGKGQGVNGAAGQPGGGSGSTPAPGASPSPTPTPSQATNSENGGKSVPKHLDCVGDPPRQIPDTQSPPCISSYDGPPATQTYPGVTANTIRVAVPDSQGKEQEADWSKYLNDHFEFYGRSIQLVDYGNPTDSDTPSQDMKNKADDIANHHFFASLQTADYGGAERIFYDELARRGVVSISQRPDVRTEADYQRTAPYEWNFQPALDVDEEALATTACRQLPPGRAAAAYAGGATRKYGIAYVHFTYTNDPDLSALRAGLARCGITVADQDVQGVQYVDKTSNTGYQQNGPGAVSTAENASRQMRLDGVTTVLMLTHAAGTEDMMVAADNLGWEPEWLTSYHFYNTEWPLNPLPPQDQWTHVLGVDYKNQLVPAQDNQWYAAVEEENPGYGWPYAPPEYIQGEYMWEELLLLASGIQMAGPDLTPQTFQKGLEATVFPNPPSPYHEAVVGFQGDHTWAKDFAVVWYSPNTPGAWGQGSTWCYTSVAGRWRFRPDNEPAGIPAFPPNACVT